MRWHSTSLGLCFAVTIAVFPSITASICSVHNPAERPPCLPHTRYGRLAGERRHLRLWCGDASGKSASRHKDNPVQKP